MTAEPAADAHSSPASEPPQREPLDTGTARGRVAPGSGPDAGEVGSAAGQGVASPALLGGILTPGSPARRNAGWLALCIVTFIAGLMISDMVGRPSQNDTDVGFLTDMSDHHDQAIRLSTLELGRGSDRYAKDFATEVIIFQRFEMGKMDQMLTERGRSIAEYDPARETMAWMGHPTPLAEMSGMATEAEVDQLSSASGVAADVLFLELMIEHHRGGVEMATYAASHADDEQIRELANIMATTQRSEISEYERLLSDLT